jgi:hypothetical protein
MWVLCIRFSETASDCYSSMQPQGLIPSQFAPRQQVVYSNAASHHALGPRPDLNMRVCCVCPCLPCLLPGAVLAAKDTSVVQARRSALAYGIGCQSEWRDGMPEHLKFWSDNRMRYQCSSVFERWAVARTQMGSFACTAGSA